MLVFIYIYRIDLERHISCWNNYNFQAAIYFQATPSSSNKVLWGPSNKYDKLSLQVQCPVQSVAIFKLFLLMLLTERFSIYFCQLHYSSSQLLVENTVTYFCFTLNNYLVYCYVVQYTLVHMAFTCLRLTLIYFHLECKIFVKIPDSVLESALALQGKEGDWQLLIEIYQSLL